MRIALFRLAFLAIVVLSSSVSLDAQDQVEQPWSEVPAGSDTPIGKRTLAKLKTIIIDKLNFDRIDLREDLAYLTKRSKELDPDHVGVRIILPGTYTPAPGQPIHREVTQCFEDVPLIEVLFYICNETAHDFKIENDAVIVFSAKMQPPAK